MRKLIPLLLLFLAGPGGAQEQPAPASPLAPIAFWVGGTWHGQLPPPPGGGTAPELQTTFTWMENRQAIRFDTVAAAGDKRRPYVGGIYAWHPGKKQIVFLYADAGGGLTEGTVTVEDGVLVHDFAETEADGKTASYRARVTPQGADAYDNEIFQQANGQWVSFVKVRYVRQKD